MLTVTYVPKLTPFRHSSAANGTGVAVATSRQQEWIIFGGFRGPLNNSPALAQLGRLDEARQEGRLFMADYPSFRIEAFLDTQPFIHTADREHFAEGYRKAALPD